MIKTGKNWGETTAVKGNLFLISVFYLPLVLRFAVYPAGLGPLGVENSLLPRFLPPKQECWDSHYVPHTQELSLKATGNWIRVSLGKGTGTSPKIVIITNLSEEMPFCRQL